MKTKDQSHAHERHYDGHPTEDVLREVARESRTMDDVRQGFPALWAHLEECEECRSAFVELMNLVYQIGRQDKRQEEMETRRTVVLAAMAAVFGVVLVASGILMWDTQHADRQIRIKFRTAAYI